MKHKKNKKETQKQKNNIKDTNKKLNEDDTTLIIEKDEYEEVEKNYVPLSNLERRKLISEKIKENPSLFTVCEGCGSIAVKSLVFCPICNSYRFNDDTKYIIETANILGSKDSISINKEDYE